jgi:hypothetical protein
MRTRSTVAIAALLSCSFITPVTPAIAAPEPTSDERLAMCVTQYDQDGAGTGWVVTAQDRPTVDGLPTPTGTPEDFNFRVDNRQGADYILSGPSMSGALSRIGGSPNLFAQLAYSTKTYLNSLADVRQQNSQTPTYNWNCHVVRTVVTEVPGGGPALPPVENGPGTNNSGCGRGNFGPDGVKAPPGCGPRTDIDIIETDHPMSLVGDPMLIPGSYTTIATAQPRAGNPGGLPASDFIAPGGPWEPFGAFSVACISPTGATKGNPGSWRKKELYTGSGVCSTETFNNAPYASGREFPAADLPSNSLPPQ